MKTEKLELKHIAPYLPYGLKVYEPIQALSLELDLSTTYNTKNIGLPFLFLYGNYRIEYGLPILRPLSDLSSLLCDNIKINEYTINESLGYGEVEFSHYKGDLDFNIDGDSFLRYDSAKTINFNTFETVRTELLKGHYDIFGLIDKGLAIDAKTISPND